ncbi:hypothetical protein [Yoonia sp.]|uniref:hypothetical protein n=1 Tax=Yoonia sp. TaxID=2212373 RepID=UPI00391C73A2
MKFTVLLGCSAVSLLAACGGSSTSGEPAVVSLDQLISRAAAFEDAIGTINIDDDGLEPTAFANLPTGTANYTGIAVVGLIADDADVARFGAIGSATMVANFQTQTVTGAADNFFQLDDPSIIGFEGATGERIAGSIAYTLTGSKGDNEYTGQITGSLTPIGMDAFDVSVLGSGAFVGDTGEGFAVEAFEDGNDTFVGILALRN